MKKLYTSISIALIAIGAGGYFASGADASKTALIPCWLGLALLLIGPFIHLKPRLSWSLAGVVCLAGIIAPAWRLSKADFSAGLTLAQVCLAATLLVCATLFIAILGSFKKKPAQNQNV